MELTLLQLLGLAGRAVQSADSSLAAGSFKKHLAKLQELAQGKRMRGIRVTMPADVSDMPAGWYPKDCKCKG